MFPLKKKKNVDQTLLFLHFIPLDPDPHSESGSTDPNYPDPDANHCVFDAKNSFYKKTRDPDQAFYNNGYGTRLDSVKQCMDPDGQKSTDKIFIFFRLLPSWGLRW